MLSTLQRRKLSLTLATGILQSGGATISITGEIPMRGFVVSLRPELNHTFSYQPKRDNKRYVDKVKLNRHSLIYLEHQVNLWLTSLPELKPKELLGAWYDEQEQEVQLDVVHLHKYSMTKALRNASKHNQKSIYSINTKTTYYV